VVADVYRAKKEGRRPSEEQRRQGCAELRLYCQRWDSLRIGPDGLLTMTLAANNRHPTRERVVCPAVIRRELICDAHEQAHTGVQRVLAKLQLRWYWPNMGHDVRRRVRQCDICQVNKHGHPPGEARRWRLYAGRPWQAEAVNLVKPMPLTPKEDSEEPPLYPVGDWVWVVNYRRRQRQAARSQPQLVGPYAVVKVMPNHTYKLERSGQVSIQNEARLKTYCANLDMARKAPRCWSP